LYFIKPEEISNNKENQNEWSKDKAEEYFTKALKIKEGSLGPKHPDVARILLRLGSLCILTN
jgi:Tetratricopeptide repeat